MSTPTTSTSRWSAALASLAAGAALVAAAAPAQAADPQPISATVNDGRTSPTSVDISKMRVHASDYYYSTQVVKVIVPGGFRPGHQVRVYVDVKGDATPEGHFTVTFRRPTSGSEMAMSQTFFRGGGWGTGGTAFDCTSGLDHSPVRPVPAGTTQMDLGLDVWGCLGLSHGSTARWRAAALVQQGSAADMAPSGHRWTPWIAGWEPRPPA